MSPAVAPDCRIDLFQGLTYLRLAGPVQVVPRVGVLAWITVRRVPPRRVPHRRLVGAAFEDQERKGHSHCRQDITFHIYILNAGANLRLRKFVPSPRHRPVMLLPIFPLSSLARRSLGVGACLSSVLCPLSSALLGS